MRGKGRIKARQMWYVEKLVPFITGGCQCTV